MQYAVPTNLLVRNSYISMHTHTHTHTHTHNTHTHKDNNIQLRRVRKDTSSFLGAGNGLFANVSFEKKELICRYEGDIVSAEVYKAQYTNSDRCVYISNNKIMVANETTLGQFANTNPGKNNARLYVNHKTQPPEVNIRATRRIPENDEICIPYSKGFFHAHMPYYLATGYFHAHLDLSKTVVQEFKIDIANVNGNGSCGFTAFIKNAALALQRDKDLDKDKDFSITLDKDFELLVEQSEQSEETSNGIKYSEKFVRELRALFIRKVQDANDDQARLLTKYNSDFPKDGKELEEQFWFRDDDLFLFMPLLGPQVCVFVLTAKTRPTRASTKSFTRDSMKQFKLYLHKDFYAAYFDSKLKNEKRGYNIPDGVVPICFDSDSDESGHDDADDALEYTVVLGGSAEYDDLCKAYTFVTKMLRLTPFTFIYNGRDHYDVGETWQIVNSSLVNRRRSKRKMN